MRLVLAEDQALLRDGLARLLTAAGHDLVAVVQDGPTLTDALTSPGVEGAVVDVRLPPTGTHEGLTAAIDVRRRRPGFPVLVLSQFVETAYAQRLLADGRGAVGYLLKDRVAHVQDFLAGLDRVLTGGTVLDPEVVAGLVTGNGRAPVDRLTPREREVLGLMAEGRSNSGIAAALVVTEKAVGKHINAIFTKLDLPPAPDDNRRVLAVLAHLGAGR